MTSVIDATRRPAAPALGTFERYLTLWVALCIFAGIVLGRLLPEPFQSLGRMTVAEVNIPVAVLIWLMIVPMLLKVDFGALHRVAERWRGIAVTVGINWLVKPFSMALLGWLFIGWLFRPLLPAVQIDSYIASLIILAAAPCTAMVFVWSNLTDGEPNFTLTQVALNDTIMVFAFAPIVALLLGLSSITVPWTTLFLSVPLHRRPRDRGPALAPLATGARRGGGVGADPADLAADLSSRAASDIGAALRLSGRADCAAAVHHRAAGGADRHSGLSQCRDRLRDQPRAWCAAQRRLPVGPDRRLQFLRARSRRGNRAVRISVGGGAGDCRRRVGRSAGHALGCADRLVDAGLVRAGSHRLGEPPKSDDRYRRTENTGGHARRRVGDRGDLQ